MLSGPVGVRVTVHWRVGTRKKEPYGAMMRQVHEYALSGSKVFVCGAAHGRTEHAYGVSDVGPCLCGGQLTGLTRQALSTDKGITL
eukprot:4688955-Pleurochrysis_carterae.AAC.3